MFASLFGLLEQAQRQANQQPAESRTDYVEQQPDNGWRDTYAQWAMAVFAFGATGVGVWTILLLQRTIRETRKGNRINRRIGEAQVTAYVSCEDAIFEIAPDFMNLTFTLRNAGQSPALRCQIKAEVIYTNPIWADEPFGDHPTTVAISADGGTNAVQSGDRGEEVNVFFMGHDIAVPTYARFRSEQVHFNVDCRVSWIDVFRRENGFRFALFVGSDELREDGHRVGRFRVVNPIYEDPADEADAQP